MQSSIRAIICDLDGTLAHDGRTLFPSTITKMEQCLDAGYYFAIATARPHRYLFEIFPQALFSRIWKICHNGAQLFDQQDKSIFKHVIDLKHQIAFINALTGNYDSISWYSGNEWLSDNKFTERLRQNYGIPAHYPSPVIGDSCCLATGSVEKILVVGARNSDFLIEEFRDRLCIYKSRSEDLLMISSGKVDKATAASVMLKRLGIPWKHTMAIGDDMNDATLLSSAGMSFATVEAPPALKAMAQYVAGSNNDPEMFQKVIEIVEKNPS